MVRFFIYVYTYDGRDDIKTKPFLMCFHSFLAAYLIPYCIEFPGKRQKIEQTILPIGYVNAIDMCSQ